VYPVFADIRYIVFIPIIRVCTKSIYTCSSALDGHDVLSRCMQFRSVLLVFGLYRRKITAKDIILLNIFILHIIFTIVYLIKYIKADKSE